MPLFPGVKGKQNITQHVLAGNRPEIYEEWPKSLKTLLALCWHEDPNRRPLFREIQDKFDRVIIDVMWFVIFIYLIFFVDGVVDLLRMVP